MTILPTDKRVRYSPTLAVWIVDTGDSYAEGAQQLLATMMHYAREAGDVARGCVCFPEESADRGPIGGGVVASTPRVHLIFRQGGVVIVGHGRVPEGSGAADAVDTSDCPHASAEGEQQARTLARAGQWHELWNITEPFPAAPGTLQPAEPGSEAPAAWEGKPVAGCPDRHVHPDTRADLARLASLAERSGDLDRAARAAKRDAEHAGTDARRQAADAAAAGTPMDAAAVTRTIRERQEQAEAAQITADGTRDAVRQVRERVAAGIRERQAEWLSYLHGQAAAGLARLDLVLAELESAVADLAEIDRVRQTVESPSAARLFNDGSMIAGNAVEAARETRRSAAEALAPLERAAQKASKDKAAQKV